MSVNRAYAFVYFIITFAITAVSTVAVLVQQGFYAALIWLPLPIGALGYVKARYFPLQVRSGQLESTASRSGDTLL